MVVALGAVIFFFVFVDRINHDMVVALLTVVAVVPQATSNVDSHQMTKPWALEQKYTSAAIKSTYIHFAVSRWSKKNVRKLIEETSNGN